MPVNDGHTYNTSLDLLVALSLLLLMLASSESHGGASGVSGGGVFVASLMRRQRSLGLVFVVSDTIVLLNVLSRSTANIVSTISTVATASAAKYLFISRLNRPRSNVYFHGSLAVVVK